MAEWDLPDEFADPAPLDGGPHDQGGPARVCAGLAALETSTWPTCNVAVKNALRMGAIGLMPSSILSCARSRSDRPSWTLDVYPYLPKANVAHDLGGQLHVPDGRGSRMTSVPKSSGSSAQIPALPTVLREYSKLARQCAGRGAGSCPVPCPAGRIGDDRPRTADDRAADQGGQVPGRQKPGQLRLQGNPCLNKMQVLELARCEWIDRRENVIALGPSGTGKTHIRPGPWPVRLPERPVCRLCHGRSPGSRTDGGPR